MTEGSSEENGKPRGESGRGDRKEKKEGVSDIADAREVAQRYGDLFIAKFDEIDPQRLEEALDFLQCDKCL